MPKLKRTLTSRKEAQNLAGTRQTVVLKSLQHFGEIVCVVIAERVRLGLNVGQADER